MLAMLLPLGPASARALAVAATRWLAPDRRFSAGGNLI